MIIVPIRARMAPSNGVLYSHCWRIIFLANLWLSSGMPSNGIWQVFVVARTDILRRTNDLCAQIGFRPQGFLALQFAVRKSHLGNEEDDPSFLRFTNPSFPRYSYKPM